MAGFDDFMDGLREFEKRIKDALRTDGFREMKKIEKELNLAREAAMPPRELFRSPLQSLQDSLDHVPRVQVSPHFATRSRTLASDFYEQLKALIVKHQAQVNPSHDVGVALVAHGSQVAFCLEEIGYSDPALIIFVGHTDDGAPITLVQNVTQIDLMLTTIPRVDPSEPKRPIGFQGEIDAQAN